MHNTDINYLNKFPDTSQYPVLWAKAYMYHRTSLAAVESMNAANKEIRQRMVVDLVNASILLIRLESVTGSTK